MTTPAQHTAPPWIFAYGDIYKANQTSGAVRIAQMDRNEPRTMPTERDANAEYIVRACNSYPDLVEACKIALAYMESNSDDEQECIDYATIKTALARAEQPNPREGKE